MEGVLECYVQEKPSGKKNLQTLVSLLFDIGTANYITEDYDSFLLNSTRSVSHIAGDRWENSKALTSALFIVFHLIFVCLTDRLNIEFNDSISIRVCLIVCVKMSRV